jgi:cytoskeletal protein CcmA (bactofilin family)
MTAGTAETLPFTLSDNQSGVISASGLARPGNAASSVTVVGAGTTVRGDLEASGTVEILGVVDGDIFSAFRIVVAPGGQVHGHLSAPTIVLEGTLIGDATATNALTLGTEAVVRGDITTPLLTVNPGATLVGRCSMAGPESSETTGQLPPATD